VEQEVCVNSPFSRFCIESKLPKEKSPRQKIQRQLKDLGWGEETFAEGFLRGGRKVVLRTDECRRKDIYGSSAGVLVLDSSKDPETHRDLNKQKNGFLWECRFGGNESGRRRQHINPTRSGWRSFSPRDSLVSEMLTKKGSFSAPSAAHYER